MSSIFQGPQYDNKVYCVTMSKIVENLSKLQCVPTVPFTENPPDTELHEVLDHGLFDFMRMLNMSTCRINVIVLSVMVTGFGFVNLNQHVLW